MLNDKKIKVIEMVASGDYTVVEAMGQIGMDRTTYYKWVKDEEFMATLNERLQATKNQAQKDFVSRLPKAIEEYWKICTTSTDVRTKEKALVYWMDRSLGRIQGALSNTGEQEADVEIDDMLAIVKADINKESA